MINVAPPHSKREYFSFQRPAFSGTVTGNRNTLYISTNPLIKNKKLKYVAHHEITFIATR